MSILNGTYAHETLLPEPQPFGEPFDITGEIKLENALDADTLDTGKQKIPISAGPGTLPLHRLEKNGVPVPASELGGLGDSRPISVSEGFAYVTARADGLYIYDLRDPEKPDLAGRIDTLELATGVCAADGVLAVTNRHMGCELWDVREPYSPGWLGSFCCGEAQSVRLHKNLALIGDWMNRYVRIFDISDPRKATEISFFAVDGFADGVSVIETKNKEYPLGRTLCVAATGHHSARLKNRRKFNKYSFVTTEMLAEGYGCGHGVEIFDITDPYYPEYVSSIKSPPHFGGYDTWRVFTGEGFCYFTDSMNGIFEIDLSDIYHPRFTKNFRLPVLGRQQPAPPSIQPRRKSVTGATLVNGFICAAGETGVTVMRGISAELSKPSADIAFPSEKSSRAQFHSFVKRGEYIFCAAGDEGIVILNKNMERVSSIRTKGACLDIIMKDCYFITAENDMGAAVYNVIGTILTELSRLPADPLKPYRELVDCGRYIAAQLGSVYVQALSFGNEKLIPVGDALSVGLLYHRHLARTTAGEYLVTLSLAGGPALIMSGENGFERTGVSLGAETCPIEEGACGYGGGLILISGAKYYWLGAMEKLSSLPEPTNCPGASLKGLPFVCGDKLVLLNRVNGNVEVIDISEPDKPRHERFLRTGLHPEFADIVDGKIVVACGHNGLIRI